MNYEATQQQSKQHKTEMAAPHQIQHLMACLDGGGKEGE